MFSYNGNWESEKCFCFKLIISNSKLYYLILWWYNLLEISIADQTSIFFLLFSSWKLLLKILLKIHKLYDRQVIKFFIHSFILSVRVHLQLVMVLLKDLDTKINKNTKINKITMHVLNEILVMIKANINKTNEAHNNCKIESHREKAHNPRKYSKHQM